MTDHTTGAHTWPEQDAVEGWVMSHPEVFGSAGQPSHEVLLSLKDAVTFERLKVQKELERSEKARAVMGGYNLRLRQDIWRIWIPMAFIAGAVAVGIMLKVVGYG